MAVQFRNVSKSFGPIQANQDINLEIEWGKVHAIIGENGAGKSTLMNLLYGINIADSGTILIDGNPVHFRSPADALAAGIGMVHQHFMLIEKFTVYENILLGRENHALLEAARDDAESKIAELQKEFGISIDLDQTVEELPVGKRQQLEILKALFRRAKILILDEPTGVLTPDEARGLFRLVGRLKEAGNAVIFISHKMDEVIEVSDRVAVMRNGQIVGQRHTPKTNAAELAELMVGRSLQAPAERNKQSSDRVLLELNGVGLKEHGVPRLADISLEVKSREVVGIAGVSGNGQSELLDLLAGLRTPTTGTLRILGDYEISPHDARSAIGLRRMGMGFVAEDRLRKGAVKSLSARENAILGYQDWPDYKTGARMDSGRITRACARVMEDFDVRPPDPHMRFANFSGGNQQKLVYGRELAHEPRLLILGEPTRGVDIGTVQKIHDSLIEFRNAGGGVLLVSSDLDELLAVADRILVFFEGRIMGESAPDPSNINAVGLMMAGRKAPDLQGETR